MTKGWAVLTNGIEWRLFRVEGRKTLAQQPEQTVTLDNRAKAAEVLYNTLGRHIRRE